MQTVSATQKCADGQLREDCINTAVLKAKEKAAQFGAEIVLIDGKIKASPVAVKLRSIVATDCPNDNGTIHCTVTVLVELLRFANTDLDKRQIAVNIAEFEQQIAKLQRKIETLQEQLQSSKPKNQRQNIARAQQLTSLIAQPADLVATIHKLTEQRFLDRSNSGGSAAKKLFSIENRAQEWPRPCG